MGRRHMTVPTKKMSHGETAQRAAFSSTLIWWALKLKACQQRARIAHPLSHPVSAYLNKSAAFTISMTTAGEVVRRAPDEPLTLRPPMYDFHRRNLAFDLA